MYIWIDWKLIHRSGNTHGNSLSCRTDRIGRVCSMEILYTGLQLLQEMGYREKATKSIYIFKNVCYFVAVAVVDPFFLKYFYFQFPKICKLLPLQIN